METGVIKSGKMNVKRKVARATKSPERQPHRVFDATRAATNIVKCRLASSAAKREKSPSRARRSATRNRCARQREHFMNSTILIILSFAICCLPGCTSAHTSSVRARAGLPAVLPSHAAFFECSLCGTLHGGFFTDGVPVFSLTTRDATSCKHHWVGIRTKSQFMRRVELREPGIFELFRHCAPHNPYWDDPRAR